MLCSMPHSLSARKARTAPPGTLGGLLLALACTLGISACGNRGPLYLPDAPEPVVASPDAEMGDDLQDDPDERPRTPPMTGSG
jgi:predicted small lipoprotein YifL